MALMPNDEGLRHCKCGRFVLMKDLVEVETAESSNLPHIDYVTDVLLPQCIAASDREDVEVAARLGYWRLNHPYRQKCTGSTEKQKRLPPAAWQAANPDHQNLVG